MKKTPIVRSLAQVDPVYGVAADLVARLKSQLAGLDSEENALRFKLANQPPEAERTSRVAALLGEEIDANTMAPDGMNARLTEISRQRADLRSAIEIARQRQGLARIGASKLICAEVRSEYTARVTRIAKAMIELAQANATLVEIAEALEAQDVMWTGELAPMQAIFIGHRGDRVGAWLRDAKEAGFIKASDIPPELRP